MASVVVDKFAWHNPLYRQAQIMKLQGLPADRSRLAFWVGVAAAELKPIYLRMKEILLGSAKIAVDETRAPVLDPGRGRTKTGYFWAISRDDRPWGGSEPPGVGSTGADGQPRCEYQCGRVAPERQLYAQPYMRTDPIKTGYIFRIRSNAARWGQSTAYCLSWLWWGQ